VSLIRVLVLVSPAPEKVPPPRRRRRL